MAADPALSAGAERRGYRVHVPTGYRQDRPAPAGRSGPAPAGSSSGSTSCASPPTCSTTSRGASAPTRPSRPIAVLSMHGSADEVLPCGGQDARVASPLPLPLPALPAWLGEWAARDGCPGDPAIFLDTAEVTGVRWSGCRDGTEVVHYRINGGTHQAPRAIAGRPFAAHPLPG